MFSLSWNMGSQFEEGVPFEWAHTRSGENMVSHRFLLQLNYVVKVPLASKFELTCGYLVEQVGKVTHFCQRGSLLSHVSQEYIPFSESF